MKTVILFIVFTVIGAYTVGRFYSQELQTTVTIDADRDVVWQYLSDFEQYPQWNPFVTSIEGKVSEGAAISVLIDPPEGKPMGFKPTLLVVDENKELRWLGRLLVPGLFDGEHYFRILENEAGRVEFVHGERFTGLLAWLLLPTIVDDTRAGFVAMNNALKQVSERAASQHNLAVREGSS